MPVCRAWSRRGAGGPGGRRMFQVLFRVPSLQASPQTYGRCRALHTRSIMEQGIPGFVQPTLCDPLQSLEP